MTHKTKIVTAKGHHITPHHHTVKGTISRTAHMSNRQQYGSKGNYRSDYSMKSGKGK